MIVKLKNSYKLERYSIKGINDYFIEKITDNLTYEYWIGNNMYGTKLLMYAMYCDDTFPEEEIIKAYIEIYEEEIINI